VFTRYSIRIHYPSSANLYWMWVVYNDFMTVLLLLPMFQWYISCVYVITWSQYILSIFPFYLHTMWILNTVINKINHIGWINCNESKDEIMSKMTNSGDAPQSYFKKSLLNKMNTYEGRGQMDLTLSYPLPLCIYSLYLYC
jgi:hypothetical protein